VETRNLRRLDIARKRWPALRRRWPNHPHGGDHAWQQEVRKRTLFSEYIDNIDKIKSEAIRFVAGSRRAVRGSAAVGAVRVTAE
jgi:hypothetical protein